MAGKYPSRDEIQSLFSNLEDANTRPKFFERVSKDVDWLIMGTSPMSRRFHSLDEFNNATLNRLAKVLKEPLRFQVMNVIGGDQEWATVELKAHPVECKNGLPYKMVYCWVVRFNPEGVIVQVRAYLDTQLLTQALQSNECEVYNTPSVEY